MTDIVSLTLLIVIVISSFIVKRDTKDLISRSDKIQKALNTYIKKEQNKKS
jgi:metal-responsive CopG/Arc/MetJ family transcriptional regulator